MCQGSGTASSSWGSPSNFPKPRVRLGEASRVAPMDKLSVLFAILFAAIVLRETLTWHQWLGGALLLIGAVILASK
ncbi:MAG: hypothetical protein DMF16_07605 [Verrucomicrobia bacterium]|nr:MAG: hypothetical protein DMF16_07605 [Verrucomicrobiota bacterium]